MLYITDKTTSDIAIVMASDGKNLPKPETRQDETFLKSRDETETRRDTISVFIQATAEAKCAKVRKPN